MADLGIDTRVLRDTGGALRLVATEFSQADARSEALADALGHPGLAERVRELAHGWRERREEVVDGIVHLADAATAVGEVFEQLDTELAASVRGDR